MPNLTHFIGKVCTVFTVPINRDYQKENPKTYPQQLYAYFMGVVESIDQHGVMLTQLLTGKKTFFYHSSIVGIAEEEVIDPEDPNNKQIMEEMKTSKEIEKKVAGTAEKDRSLVNIDHLESLTQSQ
jgi:hypothetical protein